MYYVAQIGVTYYIYQVYYTYEWTLEIGSYFAIKNNYTKPRRERTRARPRPPPADSGEVSKVRHDEQTAHRMVDFIWSHISSFTAQTLVKNCLLDCSDGRLFYVYFPTYNTRS